MSDSKETVKCKRREKEKRRHRNDESSSYKRQKKSNRHRSRSQERDHARNKKEYRSSNRHDRSTNRREVEIKREEDFDRRQEEARRKRLDAQNQRDQDNRNRSGADKFKQAIKEEKKPVEKEKANLGLSGNLTADTNTYKGVVIKYNEPPEAAMTKKKWRLYPFKGEEQLKILHMHRQSAYLMGKNYRICDIPIVHPSISKQHAVFQYRAVEKQIRGVMKRVVRPFIIDLNSANGTTLNGEKIQPQRYYELKEKDCLKFAFSSREYVLLHDKTDTSHYDESSNESSDSD